jgi:hypothetical protein
MRSFLPWLFALFAFPIGGTLALLLRGSLTHPKNAAMGGLIAGLIVGLAQWLALRGIVSGIRPQWIIGTALGCSLGTALGQVIAQGTGIPAVLLRGLASGAIVGLSQYSCWQADVPKPLSWIPVVGLSWALAWLTTRSIGVDLSRGYVVFGASGALVFQSLTGLALYLLPRIG